MFQFNEKIDFTATKLDVLTVGEVLVDIISDKLVPSLKEARSFNRHFGGSPANIAMNLKKLGAKSGLLSKVGADGLGDYLIKKLETSGVDTRGIVRDSHYNTSAVLVTQSKATPEFIAYRDAEKYITKEDIKEGLISEAKIIHLSTFALAAPVTRQTLLEIVEIAQKERKIVSLDPNYRPQLWEGNKKGQEFIKKLLSKVNITKPSLDDAKAIFGLATPKEYIQKFHQAGAELVILTLGADGVLVSTGEEIKRLDTFATKVVDTTGAGDAFWSGLYSSLVTGDKLERAIKVGNATAALALQEVGAITDLPTKDKVVQEFNL
ncbi:sugar kinase, ribokinase [Halobacteroides halobius DSM 5150]|uniref:Sugar kinase, ribokinase n=1 Tax=Halobacteroides halobius (strain ATCC 35273 / DSM 5150 / MD-1) TaxID=748449 RepID=L0KB27_HALHC|nr:carbohydrate kinase [Halobacteroides halobius]AGB41740.1 sugar kinase, ribokinase [Halobacteroides halobius DSM 5150]